MALLRDLGPWGVAVVVLYLMAGALRLARFNVVSDAHAKERKTLGVPIPIGAGYADGGGPDARPDRAGGGRGGHGRRWRCSWSRGSGCPP